MENPSVILTIKLICGPGVQFGSMSVTDVCVALHGGVPRRSVLPGFWNVLTAATTSSIFVTPCAGDTSSTGASRTF